MFFLEIMEWISVIPNFLIIFSKCLENLVPKYRLHLQWNFKFVKAKLCWAFVVNKLLETKIHDHTYKCAIFCRTYFSCTYLLTANDLNFKWVFFVLLAGLLSFFCKTMFWIFNLLLPIWKKRLMTSHVSKSD